MITLQSAGVRWQNGAPVPAPVASPADREKTMAYQIFRRHNQKEEAGQPTTSPMWASSRPPRPAA